MRSALLPGFEVLQLGSQLSNYALQIFDGGDLIAQRLWQLAGHAIGGNSDWFGHIAQRILDD